MSGLAGVQTTPLFESRTRVLPITLKDVSSGTPLQAPIQQTSAIPHCGFSPAIIQLFFTFKSVINLSGESKISFWVIGGNQQTDGELAGLVNGLFISIISICR